MNLSEWVRRTRDRLRARPPEAIDRGYSLAEVQTVLEAALSALVGELAAGGELSLSDLGKLTVETRQPRTIHSRLLGQQTTYRVKARRRVTFHMSRRLKRTLNPKTGGKASDQS